LLIEKTKHFEAILNKKRAEFSDFNPFLSKFTYFLNLAGLAITRNT